MSPVAGEPGGRSYGLKRGGLALEDVTPEIVAVKATAEHVYSQ